MARNAIFGSYMGQFISYLIRLCGMFCLGHSPLNITTDIIMGTVAVGIQKRSNTFYCSAICSCSIEEQ